MSTELHIILAVVLGIFGTILFGLVFQWVDRLVTARIQWRKGPPFYQPLAEVVKRLGKETVIADNTPTGLFLLATQVGLVGVCVAATILWAGILKPEAGFVGDLIVVVYFLTFPSLMLILGGSASGSPFGATGAAREMKLVIGYELPFILALVPPILLSGGTLKLSGILAAQAQSPMLLHLSGFLGFLCVLAVVQAKLGVVPFDQAEAETELTGGVMLEYSGPPLAMIRLVRGMLLFVLPLFVVTVFWGGVNLTGWGWIATPLKFLALLVVVVLMRNTNARLRIDQALRFFWFIVTPLAVVAAALSIHQYAAQ